MLALTPLRSCNDENISRKGTNVHEMDFTIGDDIDDFSCAGNLLEDIDFDDLFVGMDYGDVLPDLEIDPEMLEFPISNEESCENLNLSSSLSNSDERLFVNEINNEYERRLEQEEEEDRGSGSGSGSSLSKEDEIVSKRDEDESIKVDNPILSSQNNKESSSSRNRKSMLGQMKNSSQGKRKVKVDWTPELHRRFVQAVEQLGMDKAVPSRILEIMGIDCLTRHNIASHLQKYRSHQKHLLAREAEAASWNQRRQVYGGVAAAATTRGGNKRPEHLNPWIAPTMGFPPPTPSPLHPQYRPLHVWGHPTVDPSSMMHHVWPKHLLHNSPSPPPPPHRWPTPPIPPPPPPSDPSSYWHPNHHPNHHQRAQNALTSGTPCFPPQALPATLLQRMPSSSSLAPAPPTLVPGIPPPPLPLGIGGAPPGSGHPDLLHPTKERIDAAIGDVLSKPWQPLPLGLKPPSLDSVMVELHRQGIPKIPPTTTTTELD